MDELLAILTASGITAEVSEKIVETAKGLLSAETEKGKGFYREKDSEALKLKQALKEKEDLIAQYTAKNSTAETTLESLKKAIEDVKAERDAEKQSRIEEANKATKESVKNKLLSALGGKVKMANHVIAGILAEHEIGSGDGGYTIAGKTIDDFTSEFIKANESDIVTDQIGGTGSTPSTPQDKGWATKSLADLKKDNII